MKPTSYLSVSFQFQVSVFCSTRAEFVVDK